MSTGTTKSYMIAVDQHHHHEKSRRNLRIILIILGIIIVLAALFLAIAVYRALKSGAFSSCSSSSYLSSFLLTCSFFRNILGYQRNSLATSDGNITALINNQSFIDSRPDRCKKKLVFLKFFSNDKLILACQYGRIECDFSATCTPNDECQCIFSCNDTDELVQDEITGITYPNQCRLDEARCHSYYQPLSSSKKGMLRRK